MAIGMKKEFPALILFFLVSALLLGIIALGFAVIGGMPSSAVNTSGGGEGSSGGFFSRLFPAAGMKNAAPP